MILALVVTEDSVTLTTVFELTAEELESGRRGSWREEEPATGTKIPPRGGPSGVMLSF